MGFQKRDVSQADQSLKDWHWFGSAFRAINVRSRLSPSNKYGRFVSIDYATTLSDGAFAYDIVEYGPYVAATFSFQ